MTKLRKFWICLAVAGCLDVLSRIMFGFNDEGFLAMPFSLIHPLLGVFAGVVFSLWILWAGIAWFVK